MTTVRIQRDVDTLAIPYGPALVAGVGAAALAFVGLIIPIFWIESAAFQLYLDQITTAAVPPLGYGARVAAIALLAMVGALIGLALAKVFGVVSNGMTFGDALARLRGIGSDDDPDAPALRAADRHPDAPARRPFSAASDIPVRDADDPDADNSVARGFVAGDFTARDSEDYDDDEINTDENNFGPMHTMVRRDTDPTFDDDADDDNELLLDAHFAPAGELGEAPASLPEEAWDVLRTDAVSAPDNAVVAPRAAPADDDAPVATIDLSPPQLDDWDNAAAVKPPEAADQSEVAENAAEPASSQPALAEPALSELALAEPAPPASTTTRPAPLDLSVARLDELLARLEAGLQRKAASAAGDGAAAMAGVAAPMVTAPSPGVEAPTLVRIGDNDPEFPLDPALAAALATLRRLNQKTG